MKGFFVLIPYENVFVNSNRKTMFTYNLYILLDFKPKNKFMCKRQKRIESNGYIITWLMNPQHFKLVAKKNQKSIFATSISNLHFKLFNY